MLPFSFIASGTYSNTGTLAVVNIALPAKPDWFFVKDLTNWGKATTAANPIYSEWFSNMAQGSFLGLGQPSSGTPSSVTTYATQGASGGFSFIDQSNPPTYSKVALTAITGTSTWVVSTGTTTGINVGDMIRLINVTSMLQFSSILFVVTAVVASTSITLGLAATAKTAGMTCAVDGTTGFYQKVYPGNFYPNLLPVLEITQASQAKVYFGRPNSYTPGELVDFQVPSSYGMFQISNLAAQSRGPARVLVATNTAVESSITLDLDTTGFSAFAIPATATYASVSASPATCFPAGSGIVPFNGSATIPASPPGTNLLDAFDNRNQFLMSIGTSACGIANAQMQWFAFKQDFSASVNA